jgi:hypothetical protein
MVILGDLKKIVHKFLIWIFNKKIDFFYKMENIVQKIIGMKHI